MISDLGRSLGTEELTSVVAAFAAANDETVAAIEYLGKRRARIVLTSTEQALVVPAATVEVARQACEDAGVPVDNGWERELTELSRPTNDLWRARARREMAR
ncbi:MAG: hypothetical protein HOU81_25500 [Hamadaea sp.]|uniref:hypothetical protein n=1 Tax=Hamadaea sp. TaxID=2024425 RepID=UPI00181C1CCE|nr:hypothetical protein [Hamadaea sp.]NUR74179.1 hypothetical protein [Hamadaea sp.]NUT20497.1 hypothetical protein [Hamadaea sp.]